MLEIDIRGSEELSRFSGITFVPVERLGNKAVVCKKRKGDKGEISEGRERSENRRPYV